VAQGCVAAAARSGIKAPQLREIVRAVVDRPSDYREHPHFGPLAQQLLQLAESRSRYRPRGGKAPYRKWGDDLDAQSIQQMENACSLPVAVRGALMPDAHVGYGLPIGGVLATRDAVIPYAVGVDIACRMKMTALDLSPELLVKRPELFRRAIEDETRFGIGASFERGRRRRSHDVMDDDWSVTGVTAGLKDKAWAQLGSSGSGNHFVEFGLLTIEDEALGLEPQVYLALLSHSGSRGAGATVAAHYSRVAMQRHPELPSALRHLAWLDMRSPDGREYWDAMELMGRYASANHACIHRHIARHLGAEVLLDIENHHNFAWVEEHDGERLIVHRKGATPAGSGVIGIIPGSMASSTYVVRGKGSAESLRSAAHGAGRAMSRTQAKNTFRWKEARDVLEKRGVTLLSAGLDEVPMVYKDIEKVMAAQSDLVEPIARFEPKLVKMAPEGERPED
jgi:tRNA-splicing ligase RtcB